jgi:hypothetical protein
MPFPHLRLSIKDEPAGVHHVPFNDATIRSAYERLQDDEQAV